MRIPRAVFGLIYVAADNPKPEYAINGVRVMRLDRRTCAAVATNGRIIMEITWPDESQDAKNDLKRPFAVTIPGKLWKLAIADDPSSLLLDENQKVGDGVVLSTETAGINHTFRAPNSKLKFPKHEEVIPKYTRDDSVSIGVSAKWLGALCMAFEGTTETAAMRLTVPSASIRSLYLETIGDGDVRARAAIMPIVATTGD